MKISDLDDIAAWQYELPQELIASRPAARRDDARLMVVRRDTGIIEHRCIRDLPELLNSGDRCVFNNTKVVPARLFGYRTSTGGRWEGLFLDSRADGCWRVTGQTRGRLKPGESLTITPAATIGTDPVEVHPGVTQELELELLERVSDGSWIVRPSDLASPPETLLQTFGTLPLPPYIGRKVADSEDRDRYQTMFARETGAIAAPTAGLHFTPELLRACHERGIERSEVTLHVGIGTFRPVSATRLSEHEMHSERCRITIETVQEIESTRNSGGRIVAVGTTAVRTLESAVTADGLAPFNESTRLFIQPGFPFRVVDCLLTNFHLPGSTLIVLVAAFAGYELTMEAYRQAVRQKYRFYSYGDAMLLL